VGSLEDGYGSIPIVGGIFCAGRTHLCTLWRHVRVGLAISLALAPLSTAKECHAYLASLENNIPPTTRSLRSACDAFLSGKPIWSSKVKSLKLKHPGSLFWFVCSKGTDNGAVSSHSGCSTVCF
jgi:hypothetical protein